MLYDAEEEDFDDDEILIWDELGDSQKNCFGSQANFLKYNLKLEREQTNLERVRAENIDYLNKLRSIPLLKNNNLKIGDVVYLTDRYFSDQEFKIVKLPKYRSGKVMVRILFEYPHSSPVFRNRWVWVLDKVFRGIQCVNLGEYK